MDIQSTKYQESISGDADCIRGLNDEQRAVVQHGDGPCVVLAGAGSGKTRTIVHRVAFLIARGVSPDRILLLTFTNKAAGEMMTRITALLGQSRPMGSGGIWGGTFHGVANRILRAYAEHIGFHPNFTILDQEDSKTLIKATIKDLGFNDKAKRFPSPAVVQHVISYARNAMRPLPVVLRKLHPRLAHLEKEFIAIAERYEQKKRMANAMDFDDLLVRFHELLSKDVSVRERLQERFRYILVDEYQDTNAIQASVIRLLAKGEKPNVLVVGDDAQSIYSFRAADVRNILDFTKQFPDAEVFRLETNYRSTEEILDLANDIISRNIDQYPKELKNTCGHFMLPKVIPALSASQEASVVVDRIEYLLEDSVPPEEIAVLFRATHHSQRIEFELMRRGVVYEYRGGLRFFDRAHVKDVLAFLRLTENVRDEAAWRRTLALQQGIGDVSASRIFTVVQGCDSLGEVSLLPVERMCGSRTSRGWSEMKITIDALLSAESNPSALVKAVMKSPYADYMENTYPNAGDRMDDLAQLADFAEQYDTLPEFLADIALDDAIASRTNGRQSYTSKIILSTIHQAKGLEWDAVFIVHMNDSSFPNKKAVMEDGGIEEERRLFYVATTRARRHLWLTYPTTRGYGSFGVEMPSLFLQEISHECLDTSLVEESSLLPDRHVGVVFKKKKSSFEDSLLDEGFEEEAIELDGDGEPIESLSAVKRRMKDVQSDWKKKSFLRDV